MNRKRNTILLAAMLLLFASSVWAAEPGGAPGTSQGPGGWGQTQPMANSGPGERGPDGMSQRQRMEKIEKRIEMIKMWRLSEVFDEGTSAKLFPVVSKFDQKKMELQREMFKVWRNIRQEGVKGDEASALLDKLEKLKAAMNNLEEEQNEALKKILTPEQILKYLSFEKEFQREMRQLMRESRDRRRSGPGRGGPGGPGAGGPGGPGAGGPGGPGAGGPGGPGAGGPGGPGMGSPYGSDMGGPSE